jgi:hypothetical protein
MSIAYSIKVCATAMPAAISPKYSKKGYFIGGFQRSHTLEGLAVYGIKTVRGKP